MALSFMFECSCGRVSHVYFPKEKIYGEILGDTTEDWKRIDREELEAGELELSKELARKGGGELINLPETGRIECPCGDIFDLVEFFQTAKNRSEILHDTQ